MTRIDFRGEGALGARLAKPRRLASQSTGLKLAVREASARSAAAMMTGMRVHADLMTEVCTLSIEIRLVPLKTENVELFDHRIGMA